jgi:hypothetical protein
MVDDTVQQARLALVDAINTMEPDGSVPDDAIDALIAAVRAEAEHRASDERNRALDYSDQGLVD